MLNAELHYTVAVGYKDIFENYDEQDIGTLLQDISSKSSLRVICHFMAQLHTVERDFNKQIEILNIWLNRLPKSVRKKVEDYAIAISKKRNATFNFMNNISSLILVQEIFSNYNELDDGDLSQQQELQLFKAYLLCTQRWIDKQDVKVKKVTSVETLCRLLIPVKIPYTYQMEFNDFRLEFIKAIYFFRYLESDQNLSHLNEIFCKIHKVTSWQEYLIKLANTYVTKLGSANIPTVENIPDELPDVVEWFKSLSLILPEFKYDDDFKSLREKPLFQLEEQSFLTLNLNFLVDKFFPGIQFDLFKASKAAKTKIADKEVKSFENFRSFYGDTSEVAIFYQIIEYVFEKNKFVMLRGEKIKAFWIDGEPDYYIRDKAKIYLFEHKDVLLNASIKHSNDYDKIIGELFTKFVENQKGKPKGIRQLINSITKLIDGKFDDIDKQIKQQKIIYPIIVFQDVSFHEQGFNYLLNKEMRKLIRSEITLPEGVEIKDLTLIHVNDLIKFQDLFNSKQLKINNCLNEYHLRLNDPNHLFNCMSNFSMYLHNKTIKMDYDTPKMLMEEFKKILPD